MRDGSVFVCDRANNRIQVFGKDGEFLRQIVLEPGTRSGGSVWDLVPSQDGPSAISWWRTVPTTRCTS